MAFLTPFLKYTKTLKGSRINNSSLRNLYVHQFVLFEQGFLP